MMTRKTLVKSISSRTFPVCLSKASSKKKICTPYTKTIKTNAQITFQFRIRYGLHVRLVREEDIDK